MIVPEFTFKSQHGPVLLPALTFPDSALDTLVQDLEQYERRARYRIADNVAEGLAKGRYVCFLCDSSWAFEAAYTKTNLPFTLDTILRIALAPDAAWGQLCAMEEPDSTPHPGRHPHPVVCPHPGACPGPHRKGELNHDRHANRNGQPRRGRGPGPERV